MRMEYLSIKLRAAAGGGRVWLRNGKRGVPCPAVEISAILHADGSIIACGVNRVRKNIMQRPTLLLR